MFQDSVSEIALQPLAISMWVRVGRDLPVSLAPLLSTPGFGFSGSEVFTRVFGQ